MKRWYLGCTYDFMLADYTYEAFRFDHNPHEGEVPYLYVVGPFKTKRAAKWAEKHGKRNPHFTCVEDAERLSAAA